MKGLYLAIMVICGFITCGVREPRMISCSMYTDPGFKYYQFNGGYIDLDKLEMTKDSVKEASFKEFSPYAWRFKNKIADSILLNDHQFVIENNEEKERYQLHIYRGGRLKTSVDLPVDTPLAEVREYYIHMFPYKNDVIVFMEDMYTTDYYIIKYNTNGKALMRKDVAHTYVTIQGNTHEHHPYRDFSYLTNSEMVFTSSVFSDKASTVILSLDDFSIREFKETSDGIILGEDEDKIEGFISFNEKSKKHIIHMMDGKRFEVKLNEWMPGCNVLKHGGFLYIAYFHPISTGSGLACFDLEKEKLVWTADVLQLNASHSEYWNKVTLSMYKDKLIMEGNEAYGNYVQIFDPVSGKRLAQFGLLE